YATPFDGGDDLFEAADSRVVARHYFDAPTLPLGVFAVHAEQLGGKQRRFVSAGARPNFQHDVSLVVRILGHEHDLDLAHERVAARDKRLELLLGELADIR